MSNREQQYIKGFNIGYIFSRYGPELLNRVVKELRPARGYLDGLFSGKKEYELEHIHEQLQLLRTRSQERGTDLERS